MWRRHSSHQYLTLFGLGCTLCVFRFSLAPWLTSSQVHQYGTDLTKIRQNRTKVGGIAIHRLCQNIKDTFSQGPMGQSWDEGTVRWLSGEILARDARKPAEFWTLSDILRTIRSTRRPHLNTTPPDQYPSLSREAFPVCSSTANRSVPIARLVYNRVPKCASSTMQVMLTLLGERNSFEYKSSPIFWQRRATVTEEIQLVREWQRISLQGNYSTATDRHFYFVDVVRFGAKNVTNWINMVRDPIERLVSEFYFFRHGKRWMGRVERPSQDWFNLTFSECLAANLLECRFDPGSNLLRELQLTYFCGSALECSQLGNIHAVQRAKANLEESYSVVGITSDFETSVRVMEGYLPRFFRGATSLFRRMTSPSGLEYRTNLGSKYAKQLEPRWQLELRRNLSGEYDFYEFAVARLLNQDRFLRAAQGVS